MESQEEIKQSVSNTDVNTDKFIMTKPNAGSDIMPFKFFYPLLGLPLGFLAFPLIIIPVNVSGTFSLVFTSLLMIGFFGGFIIGSIKDKKRTKQLPTPKYQRILFYLIDVIILISFILYFFS